jgi:endonuclease YncB( thermonuclease family)
VELSEFKNFILDFVQEIPLRRWLEELHSWDVIFTPEVSLLIIAGVVVLLAALSFLPHPRRKSAKAQVHLIPSGPRDARVIKILDGDSVIVSKWGFFQQTIRLGAIDCPESGQLWGDTAKYGLIKLIGGKTVRVEEHATDQYGRTVATLFVWDKAKSEWMNVNARMVILGHAWVYKKFYAHLSQEQREELLIMEQWARKKGVGLWGQSNPIPPWRWRNVRTD